MATIRLRVRGSLTGAWIENFSNYGWKVRDSSDNNWIQMTPDNTKVRSADGSKWENVK